MNYLKEYDSFIKSLIKEIPNVISNIKIETIENKSGERDLVTAADRGLEKFLSDKILGKFPNHQILGEETYDPNKKYDSGNLWVIDPIDGTTNFVKQNNDFCTIIAYFENGKPMLSYIYEVRKNDLYWALADDGVYLNNTKLEGPENSSMKEKLISTDIRRMNGNRPVLFQGILDEAFGMRSVGTSGLDGSRVLTGRFGAYLNYSGGPWDYAPFFLMCQLLDLSFLNLKGEEMKLDGYSDYIVSTKKSYSDFEKIRNDIGLD